MQQIIPTIADDLRGEVQLGLVRAEPVAVGKSSDALRAAIDHRCATLAEAHAGKLPSEIPGLAPARQLYKTFGVDPTRIRPSSEALLRRVLKNKPFPEISSAVDVCNLSAIRILLPPGLYDAGAIEGGVVLRRGRPGESFAGIRKADVNLEGRPALVDDAGPFGNPTSDSLRTSVTGSTRSLWMVVFAPASFDRERLAAEVDAVCQDVRRFLAPHAAEVETLGTVIP
jgi:DNA/RNA-binding domain of Phe-tRNA-synthetase-like protein